MFVVFWPVPLLPLRFFPNYSTSSAGRPRLERARAGADVIPAAEQSSGAPFDNQGTIREFPNQLGLPSTGAELQETNTYPCLVGSTEVDNIL